MTDPDQQALSLLAECDTDECQHLYSFHMGDGLTVDQLGYEDVFYPLRCHHREGLGLRITWEDRTQTYVWGAGDLIYRASDDVRTLETAVDPFDLYTLVQSGTASEVTVTIVEEADTEVHDG